MEYNIFMKTLLILCVFALCACGPKEIGQGTSSDRPSGKGNFSAAEVMRKPMTGSSRTEQLLYYYNKPEVMERMRAWQIDQYNRRMGIAPENPEYRSIPKQQSPFRDQ